MVHPEMATLLELPLVTREKIGSLAVEDATGSRLSELSVFKVVLLLLSMKDYILCFLSLGSLCATANS